MSATTDRAAKTVRIDNVDAANAIVTIRNTGSKDIASGEVTVFVGGALQSACSGVAVSKGSTATCDWSASACTAGTAVKVVAPGNEDSRTC